MGSVERVRKARGSASPLKHFEAVRVRVARRAGAGGDGGAGGRRLQVQLMFAACKRRTQAGFKLPVCGDAAANKSKPQVGGRRLSG